MLRVRKGADMGYFDALTSSCFKRASDERWLFFPYGILGQGYIIDSEQAYETLRRRIKAFTVTGLVLVIGGALALQRYAGAFFIAALYAAFYVVWTRFLLRGLQQSDEKLSLEESMTSQAITHSAVCLWLLEIGALAFVGLGILMLIADSRNWLMVLAPTIFFGICAAFIARMLVLRRRSRAGSAR